MQLGKAVAALSLRFGGDGHQRGLAGARSQVPVHRVVAQVGGAAHKPFGKGRVAVVAHLLGLRLPVDQLRLFAPEGVAVVDGLAVEISVSGHCGGLLGISLGLPRQQVLNS
ncbi:hypothetical protein D3C71_1769540 [compost metagenome]